MRKGFHRGTRENFMDALDETYYEQLEHDITGYQGVNTGDFFMHLKSVWCSLDTGAIEDLKRTIMWSGMQTYTSLDSSSI